MTHHQGTCMHAKAIFFYLTFPSFRFLGFFWAPLRHSRIHPPGLSPCNQRERMNSYPSGHKSKAIKYSDVGSSPPEHARHTARNDEQSFWLPSWRQHPCSEAIVISVRANRADCSACHKDDRRCSYHSRSASLLLLYRRITRPRAPHRHPLADTQHQQQ